MPRQPRRKSNTGIYHIMLRGINRQSIFEDDHDRRRFVRILERYREEVIDDEHTRIFDVYAWAIMGNHVHLVLRFVREEGDMQRVMKRICVAYSYYYNRKNARIGPVFQDRYRNEPVEDERYLFNVVRYVHMNPVKAGICDNPIEYAWSSYREYMHKQSVARVVSRGTVLLEKMGQNDAGASNNVGASNDVGISNAAEISNDARISNYVGISNHTDISNRMEMSVTAEFEKLTMEEDDGIFLEMCQERKKTISDDAAREAMKEYGCSNIEEFRELGHDERVRCIRSMLDKGAGISQISRVTGISRQTIRKMVRNLPGEPSPWKHRACQGNRPRVTLNRQRELPGEPSPCKGASL